MSKATKWREKAKAEDAKISRIAALGYVIQRFSPYHYRIQNRVDFWPSSEKWYELRGKGGLGIESLLEHLARYHPVGSFSSTKTRWKPPSKARAKPEKPGAGETIWILDDPEAVD